MKLPNLLVPGTQKGGTTTIHRLLSAHPEVFMSGNKEPGLFHNRTAVSDDDLTSYAAHFDNAPDGVKYIGESTAHYFWEKDNECKFSGRAWVTKSNVPLIREILGSDLKIILTLRDPVDRAISAYKHHATRGRISEDETILQAGERAELGIVDLGFYRRHYQGWRDALPEAGFFLTTTEELNKSVRDVYAKLLLWLELPSIEVPDKLVDTRWNSSDRMLERFGKDGYNVPPVTDEHKRQLYEIYAEEILYWKDIVSGAEEWNTNY